MLMEKLLSLGTGGVRRCDPRALRVVPSPGQSGGRHFRSLGGGEVGLFSVLLRF